MRTGSKYAALLPRRYSEDKNPGWVIRYFRVLKNFPSKCVMSLKKCAIRWPADCCGARFSCPHLLQYLPASMA